MSSALNRPEIPSLGIVANLAEQDRALLGNYGEFLPVHAEQTLITEGHAQDSLFFVISGVLHVHTEVNGRTVLLTRVVAGESLGEVNIFDPANASASVTAKEFSQVWRAARADLDAFVTAYPEAGAILLCGIIQVMSRRIRHMNEKLADRESMTNAASNWH